MVGIFPEFKSLALWVCIVFYASLSAQIQPEFKNIDQSSGLSNGRITSIVKDQHGFVWIATKNGINRYDGLDFKIYSKQNSSLSSNDISDLYIDRKQRLWVATLGGGLNLYDPVLDTFTVFKNSENPNSIASNQVNVIYEDKSGHLWLGTENGLSEYLEEKGKFNNFRHDNTPESLSHNSVTSIFQKKEGTLWIGTFGGGLNKFNISKRKFERIHPSEKYFTSFIYKIFGMDKEHILLGTGGDGLLLFNTETYNFSNYLQDLGVSQEINIVRAISRDKSKALWIGTDGNGLFKIENTGEKSVIQNFLYNSQLRSSLSGNAVYEIMEDDEENMWIGTAWNGINVLENNKNYELLFSDIVGENPTPVLSVFKQNNKLFLGLDGNGLTIFNSENNRVSYFNKENKNYIGGNYIQHIAEFQNSEDLWLGTFANGLIKFNPESGSFTRFMHRSEDTSSISYNDVRYIVPEENGDLWIATWGGGLNYFNRKTESFKKFRASENDQNTINSDNVISIQKDGNLLWLGTFGGGLDRYDIEKDKFDHFEYQENDPNSISGNNLFSLLIDSEKKIWIGTSGEGINRFDPKTEKFERFDNFQNLRYATVTAIIEDDAQNIWFSTKQGIWKFDRETEAFQNFPGLTGEFHINSAFKDENGLLYFGGINGVVRFDPEKITYDSHPPKLVLTNFKLFNKELPVGQREFLKKDIAFEDRLTLKHNADVITFEFAALKFPFSDNCEYAIKMENFDQDWRNIGKDRTATFTNLAPGDYIFKVKSREAWDEWGKDYASINVKILKPFYLQWWAFVIYALLIILLFYLFRKYIIAWEQLKSNLRLEKLTHEKDTELYNLKQQFFTNISHEIRTPVTLMLGAVNRLIERSSFVEKKETTPVRTIQKHGNHLLQLVNELLDFRNLELESIKLKVSRDNFVAYCEEIFLSFSESARDKNIDFQFESTSPEIELWFDLNQMEKILYNLLSNAFKFTPQGGKISLKITENESEVFLEVQDSGIGIGKKQREKIFERFYQSKKPKDFDVPGFGLGLSITKEIADLHDGTISVKSKKNEGSSFLLKLKKGKEHFQKKQIIETQTPGFDVIKQKPEDGIREEDFDTSLSGLQDESILIVEDNKEIRKYISGLLKPYCRVIEVENGKEALEEITQNQPDLIISDIMMPIMDGVSLTRKLKTSTETSHIPVILLTARATSIQRMEGYETGADAYITKPFNEEMLMIRIKNLLRNRNLLQEKFKNDQTLLPSDLAINSLDEKFLQKLIKVIQENIDGESLNADFISKEMGMSHSVVYKKIKAITGMTFIEFVRDFKLKMAKELIAEKGFSVSEACYRIGYSDRKYFSKLFKKKFGKNPSHYAK
ncbi:hybrid sensor histidine kinase/response regulator transcription factor [Christiangramia forsetii]|uniref:histidine kinase n=2 Tax=Christiangramia forsetii TaxID=411153 RepID=A0LXD2_CHRFK|nr:hybrid sensor histidine kinase/response regulator transcription factor [Christiangramia forsetii]GGG27523.1 hybrid sensor histidine kinase/response regulator [Christiangramia forsetii]CAL65027.1 two-component system sensor histidine kinase/response regulator hybrid [Christiangramia forsetii KT0803]